MGYSEYHNNSFCDRHKKKLLSGDQYQDDINTENPLGTGGKLAVIFANLMRNLWTGKERSLSPYKLKVRMHEFNYFVICQTGEKTFEFVLFDLKHLLRSDKCTKML